jgi:ssDNA-binding Zn-finger/Zn-ribbon topoisomerase 1
MRRTEKYLSDYPLLMKDWAQELNEGIIPEKVTSGSHRRLLWRCHKCGREWSTSVKSRVNGSGCTCDARERKILSLQKTLVKKRGSLAEVRPDLAAQWHPTKNGDITPHDVTAKSTYKVWWIDENGNEWKQEIAVRNRSDVIKGFPEQRLLVNYNDLRTEHPEIAATWHPTKNGDAIPENFKSGSSFKAWWLCEKGHEWRAEIDSRVAGRGCPVCNKERSTSFPEQTLYFYVKKLFQDAENRYYVEKRLEIDIYIPSKKVGIEYDGGYYHKSEKKKKIDEKKNIRLKELGITLIRVAEEGAESPQNTDYVINCARVNSIAQIDQAVTEVFYLLGKMFGQRYDIDIDSDRDRASIMEQYILSEKKNSLAAVAPEVLKEWHPIKNGYIKPEYIHAMSNKQFWWKCKNCGYEWKAPAYRRSKGMGCPVCAGNMVASGSNDLLTTQPVIMTEWDYDKNKFIDPRKYSAGSSKKVWWKCHVCGYQWAAVIANRTRGNGCPQCSGKVVDPKRSFAVEHPELLEQWAYDLNRGMKPEDFLSGSDCTVWWRCSNGHTWKSTIAHRNANNNCPFCGNKIILPGFNDFATVHPDLLDEWDYEKNIVKPEEVLGGSTISIHWICSRGINGKLEYQIE